MRLVPLLGLLFCVAAIAQAPVAGFTRGSLRVTESGAAEYRIPLRVPPGIAGMEPKLALAYNSQSGNGLLGMGWSLEGLSAITRCPRTMAQDGARGGVNYDANDRFCLDGQRLVAVGAEYRTERETFAKVVPREAAGNGPKWFEVWTKSGQILEYGRTDDSRIEAQGKPTTVRVWALNRISDRKGNYLAVTYTEESANGAYFPARIDYTGNSGAALSPDSSVQFTYAPRGDTEAAYTAGSVIRTVSRLSSIKAYARSELVHDYRLSYDQNGAMGRSRLVNVTECGAANACLSPITLTWQSGPEILGTAAGGALMPASLGGYSAYSRLPVDLNGDGKTDLVAMYTGPSGVYAYTALGRGDGSFHPAAGGQLMPGGFGEDPYDGAYSRLAADLNGDGLADLVAMYTGPSGIYAYTALGRGDGSFHAMQGGQLFTGGFGDYAAYSRLTGDLNGDGRADLIAFYTGPAGVYVYTALGVGNGGFAPVQGGQLMPGGFGDYPYDGAYTRLLGDTNGDGKADLVVMYTGDSGIYAYTALGRGDGGFHAMQGGQLTAGGFGNYAAYSRLTGDLNGDGKADLIALYTGPAGVYAYTALGKGDGGFAPVQGGQVMPGGFGEYPYDGAYTRLLGDTNGDGKADLVVMYTGDSGIYAYTALGRGDGSFDAGRGGQLMQGGFGTYDAYSRLVVDVNGDGKSDLLAMYTGPSGLYAYASVNAAGIPDLLTSLDNGVGATVTIDYRPMTDSTVYARETSAVYPAADLQTTMPVVLATSTRDGVGGSRTTSHRYGGARVSHDGRGYLGMRWHESTDPSSGLKARTELRQDWPYVGLPSLVRKTQSSGAVLSQVANQYDCRNPLDGNACTAGAGNRYFPFVWRSVESGSDFNGAALPTLTTDTSHDAYGNPTSITVSTPDGHSKTTTNVYAPPDSVNWQHGRLMRGTVQSTRP